MQCKRRLVCHGLGASARSGQPACLPFRCARQLSDAASVAATPGMTISSTQTRACAPLSGFCVFTNNTIISGRVRRDSWRACALCCRNGCRLLAHNTCTIMTTLIDAAQWTDGRADPRFLRATVDTPQAIDGLSGVGSATQSSSRHHVACRVWRGGCLAGCIACFNSRLALVRTSPLHSTHAHSPPY